MWIDKRLYAKQRGMGLILVLVAVMVVSLVAVASISLISTNRALASNQIKMVQAFYLAEGGLEDAYRFLLYETRGNGQFWQIMKNNGQYVLGSAASGLDEIGSYQVLLQNIPNKNSIYVKSIGKVGKIEKTVEAEVMLPPFFRYLLYAQDDISLNGNIGVDGTVFAGGDVYKNGNISPQNLQFDTGIPQGDIIDLAAIKANSDLVIKNESSQQKTYTFDPMVLTPNQRVVYIKGYETVRFWGNVNLPHDVVVICDGKFDFAGNLSDTGHSLALIAAGDIELNGNFVQRVLLYAKGNILLRGNMNVRGIVFGNSIECSGNVNLQYDENVITSSLQEDLGIGLNILRWHDAYGIYNG